MSFGSNSSRTDFDPGLTADLRSVFQEGKKLYDQPYQPYPYARVAPLSPFELEGQGRAVDAARAGLGQGQVADATSTARGLSGYNMSDVDRFMNPYTQQVIDPVLRDIEQSRALQQQANASKAMSQGAFGGDRQALVDAETNRLAMQEAGDVSGRLYNVNGVQNVNNITFENVFGENSGYSKFKYNFLAATQNNVIYPSLDPSIFELKYPTNDIIGRVTI